MASGFRPLSEILRELGPLTERKASGFFFIVTDDNHSCTIRLRSGQIDEVSYSRHRNDEAVQLLSRVHAARARFQPITISAAGSRGTLGEASLRWLLGGFEHDIGTRLPSVPSRDADDAGSTAAPPLPHQRAIVEKLALHHLGPIAGLLCDEAFAGNRGIEQALGQIAANLPSAAEAQRFLAEARTALGD